MNAESPPTERSRGADPGSTNTNPLQVTGPATADTVPDQLRRRRQASRRMARLAHGGADPLVTDQERWRNEHDIALARCGWAEPWQVDRARRLWAEGVR